MIINSYIYGVAYDPDAQAFITASGISGTEATAINTLVLDLKNASLWNKMKCIYPFVGNTASSQKFNLKDARNLDIAFRLAFGGGGTFSANGYLGNGTNAFANTFFNTSTQFASNNACISIYNRTNNATGSGVLYGNSDNLTTYLPLTQFYPNVSGNTLSDMQDSNYRISVANSDRRGMYISTRSASNNFKLFKNNALFGSNTGTQPQTSFANSNLTINAFNYNGAAANYLASEIAFFSMSTSLTDLESQLFYQITEKFQVALGRNVNPTQTFYYNPAYNNETNAFLFSTQITDATIQTATNTLVTDLKTAGVFTKMKAIYPMVGGTATTHKFNLVNSQDSNAAFRLSFVGGWTHSSTGALPNGTNAYADTFLIPSTTFNTTTFNHLSYYSRTNSSFVGEYVMGALEANKNNGLVIRDNTNFCAIYADYPSGNIYRSAYITNQTNGQGLFIGSQTGTNIKLFKNSNLIASNTTLRLSNGNLPTVNMYLGATNYPNPTASSFTNKECAFASIGDGLTDAEALAYYNAVNAFQVSLARNV